MTTQTLGISVSKAAGIGWHVEHGEAFRLVRVTSNDD